jgi:hypothetical protein
VFSVPFYSLLDAPGVDGKMLGLWSAGTTAYT